MSVVVGVQLDSDHPGYAAAGEIAMNVFYGMSDPGHISREHVIECWEEAGVILA